MISFPQRTCHIAGAGAKRIHPVFKHIAGPPTCTQDFDGDADATMQDFLDGSSAAEVAGKRALAILPTLAAGAVALLVLSGVILVMLQRASARTVRRQSPDRGELSFGLTSNPSDAAVVVAPMYSSMVRITGSEPEALE